MLVVRDSSCLGMGFVLESSFDPDEAGLSAAAWMKLFMTSCGLSVSGGLLEGKGAAGVRRRRGGGAYKRRSQVRGSIALGPLHALHDILDQTVLVDTEMQRGASGRNGESHVGVAVLAAGEENQVADAQRPGHGRVVTQLVVAALLQPRCRVWLHHAADVLDQLRHTGTDLAGADADDHALGRPLAGLGGGVADSGLATFGADMGALLDSSFGHCYADVGMCDWSRVPTSTSRSLSGNFWLLDQDRSCNRGPSVAGGGDDPDADRILLG